MATSKTWTRTLDLDSEKLGPLKIWNLKNMNPRKYAVNMGEIKKFLTLVNYVLLIKTMRYVICCLKVHRYLN